MMGQNVRFALTLYCSVYHMVNGGGNKEKAGDKIRSQLSRPVVLGVDAMGKDVSSLFQNQKFDYCTGKMEQIVIQANRLMIELNEIGKD